MDDVMSCIFKENIYYVNNKERNAKDRKVYRDGGNIPENY